MGGKEDSHATRNMDDTLTIQDQIRRCRRLASYLTDEELRHSLEDLADKYEAQLPKESRTFMFPKMEQPEGG